MDYKKIGLELGFFSIGLGLLEVAAPGRMAKWRNGEMAKWLRTEGKAVTRLITLFGAHELLAGGMLLRAPAVSTNVWNRVLGDAMDLTALGLTFEQSNRKGAVAGTSAFVGGATVLDALTAGRLDQQTARTFPRSERAAA